MTLCEAGMRNKTDRTTREVFAGGKRIRNRPRRELSSWREADRGKCAPSIHTRSNHIMAAPADFLNFIDDHKDRFIQRLASAVEIPRYPIDHLALAGPDTD